MSIDYGDVRIGIALTDPLKVIASGYRTINNDKNSFQEIYRMSTEMDVETIVIGMPFDADSKIGNAAETDDHQIRFCRTGRLFPLGFLHP